MTRRRLPSSPALLAAAMLVAPRAGSCPDCPRGIREQVRAVEGVIDHHLLGIHHVVERPGHLPFDLAFLASGVIFSSIGALLVRAPRHGSGR